MSKFGWSLPPGCGRLPGEEPTPPCSLCGKDVESDDPIKGCQCPECPECGEHGCLTHFSLGNLLTKMEILHSQLYDLEREYKKRCEAQAVNCPGCQVKIVPQLGDGSPMWCDTCKKEVDYNGQFVETEWDYLS